MAQISSSMICAVSASAQRVRCSAPVPANPISQSAMKPGSSRKPDTFSVGGGPSERAPVIKTRLGPSCLKRMPVKSMMRSGVA